MVGENRSLRLSTYGAFLLFSYTKHVGNRVDRQGTCRLLKYKIKLKCSLSRP